MPEFHTTQSDQEAKMPDGGLTSFGGYSKGPFSFVRDLSETIFQDRRSDYLFHKNFNSLMSFPMLVSIFKVS